MYHSPELFAQAGQDEDELFWPVIALVVNDNPEGHRLTGVFGSDKTSFPCRMCGWVTVMHRTLLPNAPS